MNPSYLSKIYLYPVKSLAGIGVDEWPVTPTGLLYDRHWMLIDAQQNFLSQRHLPRMTLIKTALTASHLILSAPEKEDLKIGLTETTQETLTVKVWDDLCLAYLVSEQANMWLSDFLGQPCRLVFQSEADIRAVDPDYANASDQTSFSDGFPFLIIGENSLADLNTALTDPIEMLRFRPNLVVGGSPAYAEDAWRKISINTIEFRLPKPCSRCPIPTIDLITAQYGKEPLTTLNRYRKWGNKVYFGQNALHDQIGLLKCNSEITVIESGPKQPPL